MACPNQLALGHRLKSPGCLIIISAPHTMLSSGCQIPPRHPHPPSLFPLDSEAWHYFFICTDPAICWHHEHFNGNYT